MSSGNYFKNYNRGRRVQMSDESFKSGMRYTNTPLQMGNYMTSINFDAKDNGELLVPRPAIQTSKISGKDLIGEYGIVIDGKSTVEQNVPYEKVLLGDVTSSKLANSDVYTGTITPITITHSEEDFYLSQTVGVSVPTTYKKPIAAKVHDLSVSDTSPMASNIGTFGFNNSYYCFNATTAELMQSKFNSTTSKYEFEALAPKNITPKESVSWGYNMLQEDAYIFEDTEFIGTVQLLGLLPYKNGSLALNAKVNETVKLRCYYAGDKTKSYSIKWEWKELTGTDWTEIKTEAVSLTTLPEIIADFSFPSEVVLIRVTFTKDATDYPEQVLTVSFDLTPSKPSSTNLEPTNYDLHTASGMTYWKNRLIVYGLAADPNLLFMSDINDPTYFPYPNNADVFDEPIKHIMPFLDNLLIFTSTNLYMLVLSEDGTYWTKTHIQSNLDIKDWDIHLIQQVKHMVFFKSGNYYYMVVPSTRVTTLNQLIVMNVSKNMERFFDGFKENIDSMVDLLYDYKEGLELVHYYNFLDYEDVHNVYTFKTTYNVYLNIVVLYNTVSRTWRLHCFESANIVQPYKQDTTKKGTLISILNGGVQFLNFNPNSAKDGYILSDYTEATLIFKNYQLYDSGYRELSTDYNKRFREFQMKLNNISQRTLSFSTDFFIDGELRQDMYNYKVTHITDQDDPTYLSIAVEKELIPRAYLPGTTILAENEEDNNSWQLDISGFPEIFLWKIRVPVSGKGLSPRMRFISHNEEIFELLNVTWIYRNLNSR